MKKAIHLNSALDTEKLGTLIATCVERACCIDKPVFIIGLVGKLGAGKTTLTQALAKQLGIDEAVSSPTFLMLNEYHSGRIQLYHFDLYRLQEDLNTDSGAAQALKAELAEFMSADLPAIAVVEWINLWEDFGIDYDELRIDLDYADNTDGRLLNLSSRGPLAADLRKCIESAWQQQSLS